jgi:hypothetical protein
VRVPINLNTGTKEELSTADTECWRAHIGGVAEYRGGGERLSAQFDNESGKYVGQQETDRLKQYVFIPAN